MLGAGVTGNRTLVEPMGEREGSDKGNAVCAQAVGVWLPEEGRGALSLGLYPPHHVGEDHNP